MVQESNFVSTSIDCNDSLLSVTDLKKSMAGERRLLMRFAA